MTIFDRAIFLFPSGLSGEIDSNKVCLASEIKLLLSGTASQTGRGKTEKAHVRKRETHECFLFCLWLNHRHRLSHYVALFPFLLRLPRRSIGAGSGTLLTTMLSNWCALNSSEPC